MSSNYKDVCKKYRLPLPEEIEEKFEISLKEEDTTLQSVRNEIIDKLYDVVKTLEALIFIREGSDPDMLFIEKMISELSSEAFELYKKMNSRYFSGLKLKFQHDRQKDADFIKTVFKEWNETEKTMTLVLESIENGWKTIDGTNGIKEEIYHG